MSNRVSCINVDTIFSDEKFVVYRVTYDKHTKNFTLVSKWSQHKEYEDALHAAKKCAAGNELYDYIVVKVCALIEPPDNTVKVTEF